MVGAFFINRWHANRADPGWRDYNDHCGICHHGGQGQSNETPPLFGRLGVISTTPEGKRYIIHVLLNGMSGPIVADGRPFSWSMPAFSGLGDAKIARILTWVARQQQGAPGVFFTAKDIAMERQHTMSSASVREERDRLRARQPLP